MVGDCYLDLLPPEMKGHLLKFCDGSTIIALGSVSPSWREFVLNNNNEEWWRVCYEEIEVDHMLDILLSLYPRLWLEGKVFWSDIYVSWKKWRKRPLDFKLNKIKVFNTTNEITIVRFSGVWIFVGTREGLLAAVNVDTGETITIMNRCGPISEIYLRCTSNKEMDGILSGCEHDELILCTKYYYLVHNLRNGKTTDYGKLKDFLQLKYFGNQEVKIYNIHHRSEVKSSCTAKKEVVKASWPDTCCSVLQIWNERILLWFDDGTLQVYDYKLQPVQHDINGLVLDLSELNNKRLVVAHLDVLFLLADGTSSNVLGKGFVVIVGKKMKTYQPLQDLGGEVTAVLYHAGCLFLGTSDGFLFIFSVDSDKDLLSLDLRKSQYQQNVTNDCFDPIACIAVLEDVNSHFLLAAASLNSVYLISSSDLGIFS